MLLLVCCTKSTCGRWSFFCDKELVSMSISMLPNSSCSRWARCFTFPWFNKSHLKVFVDHVGSVELQCSIMTTLQWWFFTNWRHNSCESAELPSVIWWGIFQLVFSNFNCLAYITLTKTLLPFSDFPGMILP